MDHLLISTTQGDNALHRFTSYGSYGTPAKGDTRNFRVWQIILLTLDEENALIA